MFRGSARLPPNPARNALTRRLDERRAAGHEVLDLTLSNPTRAGLDLPPPPLAVLADPAAAFYDPLPRGLPAARAAVVADCLARHPGGVDLTPEQVVLTASTSEAYTLLFKLLCDPGDEILVPAPGYPLFDHLAPLDAVRPVSYPLEFDAAWQLDVGRVVSRCTPRTRAVVLVSPHNPTGWTVSDREWRPLLAACAEREVALIVDEVFADFAEPPAPTAAVAGQGLVFSLGGLSKGAALPQVKVGWIVAGGAPARWRAALEHLDWVSDSYLSVATPQQIALPALLRWAPAARAALRARLARNRAALEAAVHGRHGVELVPSTGCWSAVLRLPATRSDEQDALALLDEHGVLVQPGYFFDFGSGTWLVLSLLPEPAVFDAALARWPAFLARRP